jgi:hypothetical protein
VQAQDARIEIDTKAHFSLPPRVVKLPLLALFCLAIAGCASAPPPQPRQVQHLAPLPVALDSDFSFRKIIQYFLDPAPKAVANLDASVGFERYYRNYGAVTALDLRQRLGNYYTLYWRAKHPADVTVRFEYRQEKLHAYTQAREVAYHHAHGTMRTVFAVIGDDFIDDGRVIAWRASLVVNGRVVAQNRSYLWE